MQVISRKKNLYPQKNRYLSEFEIVLSKNSVKLQGDLHVIFALMQLSMNGDVFVSRPEEANWDQKPDMKEYVEIVEIHVN